MSRLWTDGQQNIKIELEFRKAEFPIDFQNRVGFNANSVVEILDTLKSILLISSSWHKVCKPKFQTQHMSSCIWIGNLISELPLFMPTFSFFFSPYLWIKTGRPILTLLNPQSHMGISRPRLVRWNRWGATWEFAIHFSPDLKSLPSPGESILTSSWKRRDHFVY